MTDLTRDVMKGIEMAAMLIGMAPVAMTDLTRDVMKDAHVDRDFIKLAMSQ